MQTSDLLGNLGCRLLYEVNLRAPGIDFGSCLSTGGNSWASLLFWVEGLGGQADKG